MSWVYSMLSLIGPSPLIEATAGAVCEVSDGEVKRWVELPRCAEL